MARTVNQTLIFLILCTLVLSAAPTARGAGCAKTCVSMHRERGELVITARRDPRPIVRSSPAPSASASFAPKKSTQRARPKFSDQIRELLPEGSFTLLPRRGASHQVLANLRCVLNRIGVASNIIGCTSVQLVSRPDRDIHFGENRR